MNKRSIVIVSYKIYEKVIEYYNNFNEYNVIVVCPKFTKKNEKIFSNITFYKDDFFMQDLGDIQSTHRPKWYYQQFLKYKIVLKLNFDKIHIIDGDSILSPEHFFTKDFHYSPIKINSYYQKFTNVFDTNLKSKRNFIVNHMVFEKQILINFLHHYGTNENDFIKDFCKELKDGSMWFSEYQNYALYVLNNQSWRIKTPTKVFRRLESVIKTYDYKTLFKHYSLLAYERYHKKKWLNIIRINLHFILKRNLG